MQRTSAVWILFSLLAVVYAQGPPVPVCAQPCVAATATGIPGCAVTDTQCLCSSSSFVSSVVQCASTVCTPEDLASVQQALDDTCDTITGTGTSTGTGTFTGTASDSSTFPPLSSTGLTTSTTIITPVIPPTTTDTETETVPPVTQTTGTTPPPLPTRSTSLRPTTGLGQTTDQQGQPTAGGASGDNGNNGAARYRVAGAGYLVGMAVMLLML